MYIHRDSAEHTGQTCLNDLETYESISVVGVVCLFIVILVKIILRKPRILIILLIFSTTFIFFNPIFLKMCDGSIGRTFSSGVFQARNDIPNYNRFIFGIDYTEEFAQALLKQESPELWAKYQEILAGNETYKSKRTLDFTRQGRGVIKAVKATPQVEAQQFLAQVSGQLLWSMLKIPVTLQTYDEDGKLVTQDFALQRNQVNYVDEWVCETGNIAAPYYSDNGITLIPLQLTNSSIYANLKRAIETGEWWSVVSQKIHFDIGAEKTDTNGKGEVKVYYMPPGENFIYSWNNLEVNQNANYSTPFAYADGKTAVWIKLSNRIGNNGEYQSVRNTIERVNTANIVNSAGIIAILSNRRTQYNENPCLEQVPNHQLTSLDQIEMIVPDGSCRVTAVVQTRGDNPNAQADEVYRQIGRMLIDGEIAAGGSSEGGYSPDLIDLMEQPKGYTSGITVTSTPSETVVNYSDGTNAVRQEYELGITVDEQTMANLRTSIANEEWYEMSGWGESSSGPENLIARKNQIAINTSFDSTQIGTTSRIIVYGWAGLMPQEVLNEQVLPITTPDPVNRYSRLLLGNANFPILYASVTAGKATSAPTNEITSAFNINGLVFLGGGALSLHQALGGTAVFGTQTSGVNTINGAALQTTGNVLTQFPNYYVQSAPLDTNWSFKSLWTKVKNVAKNIIPVIDKIADVLGTNEQIYVASPTIDLSNAPGFAGTQAIDAIDLAILQQFCGYPDVTTDNPGTPQWEDGPNRSTFNTIAPFASTQRAFYNMTFSCDIVPDMIFLAAPKENTSSSVSSLGIAMDVCPVPYISLKNPADSTIGDILNPNNTVFLGDLTTHLHSFTCECTQLTPSSVTQAPQISLVSLYNDIGYASVKPYSASSTPPPLFPVKGATLVTGRSYHCSVSCNFLPPSQIGTTQIDENSTLYIGFLIGYTLSNSYQFSSVEDSHFSFACVPNEASAGGNNRYVWNANGALYPALQTLNSPASNAFFHLTNIVMNVSYANQTQNPQQAV